MTSTTTVISPNVTSELYNITVTCTIHPDSTADQCEVLAVADSKMTRTGENICMYICMYIIMYTAIYIYCTRIKFSGLFFVFDWQEYSWGIMFVFNAMPPQLP